MVIKNPMRSAHDAIHGSSWLDDLARGSALVAEQKFYGKARRPLLTVQVSGDTVGSREYGQVAIAIQDATAKIGNYLAKPGTKDVASRPQYREAAKLIAHGQVGNAMYFAFPDEPTPDGEQMFGDLGLDTTAQLAAKSLIDILPAGPEDDGALDVILARAESERSAVKDIVEVIGALHRDLGLTLGTTDHTSASASVSSTQATMLKDSLAETEQETHVISVLARVDGLRTSRRTIYLETGSGKDYQAAIEMYQVPMVTRTVGAFVDAKLKEVRVMDRAGGRRRRTYSLISLEPHPQFDI